MGVITKEISEAGCLAIKQKALSNYYANPNYCRNCGIMIIVKVKQKPAEAKKKRFCSRSCAAKYNNRGVDRWQAKPSSTRTREPYGVCSVCGVTIEYTQTKDGRYYKKKYCDSCRVRPSTTEASLRKSHKTRVKKYGLNDWSNINEMTKQEVLDKCGNTWTMKCNITRYARKTYRNANKPQKCKICGYNKHVNVCHIKGIGTFSMDSLVGEINALDNLIALCPNHHWEFDHKEIK